MKKGDTIFFESAGFFIVDHVKEIVEVHGKTLIIPQEHDQLTLEEKDLLTDSDYRVKHWKALLSRKAVHQDSDKSISLKKAKEWLERNLGNYYEPDEDKCSWFDKNGIVEDFCIAMNED